VTAVALIDSNVLIAAVAQSHEHHGASLALLNGAAPLSLAAAAHSYAEVYNTLTRQGPRAPVAALPDVAWSALQSLRAATVLLGLTPAQTFDAIGRYAAGGGVGPRLYDRLIGEVAVAHRLAMIVTWNTSHMSGLFPGLRVIDPKAALTLLTGP
jgi:predicted nucleic acid-binding protein